MYYVYVFKSHIAPNMRLSGISKNLISRLHFVNNGRFAEAEKFRPWSIETYIAFSDYDLAVSFERYLRCSAGRKFSKRRLYSTFLLDTNDRNTQPANRKRI